jgi:hypothetical protein
MEAAISRAFLVPPALSELGTSGMNEQVKRHHRVMANIMRLYITFAITDTRSVGGVEVT